MNIVLTEPQTDMYEMECRYPLFVAGYGSGKTQSLIVNSLRDALSFRNVKIGSYCPTFDLLKLNLIPRLEEILVGSSIPYRLNKQDNIFTFPNGSQIIMRSMDNPARIVAYEVFRSHVDEIDTIRREKATDVWNKIIARNRQAVPKTDEKGRAIEDEFELNQISCYTTPDHGYQSFTYSKWGEAEKEVIAAIENGEEIPEAANDYKYVNAPTDSNPHNPPDYVESLKKNYPPALVQAFVEGKWVDMKGVGIFDTTKFRRWDALPSDIRYMRIYCDTAQKTKEANDWSVFQLWAYSPSMGAILVDQMRGKWEAPQLRQNLIDFWTQHAAIDHRKNYRLDKVMVEDKSSGTGLIQEIVQATTMPVEGIPRHRDKFSRAIDILPQVNMGNVWIPKNASWVREYIEEFDAFTVELDTHDDQIDPTIDAIDDMMIGSGGRIYDGAVG